MYKFDIQELKADGLMRTICSGVKSAGTENFKTAEQQLHRLGFIQVVQYVSESDGAMYHGWTRTGSQGAASIDFALLRLPASEGGGIILLE